MVEALAEASDDVDAVVAVLAKDQSSPYQFVRIAEQYRAAGRFADALSWAEQGLEHFGPSPDHRLLEVAADEHHRAGQGERAVELAWRAFEERPTPSTYERLCAQGTRAGTWNSWRTRALECLRKDVTGRMKAARTKGGVGPRACQIRARPRCLGSRPGLPLRGGCRPGMDGGEGRGVLLAPVARPRAPP